MDINWILDSPLRGLPVGDPDHVALSIEGEWSCTYRDLAERRDRWIGVLVQADIKQGDRVGILMLNSLDYVALYFAIARLGAIAVRLNYRLSPDELHFVLDDAGCSMVVLHTSRLPQVDQIRGDVDCRHWFVTEDEDTALPAWASAVDIDAVTPLAWAGPRPDGRSPLMLMYSSGTTGRPKGVVWTHEQSLWLALMQATEWGYNESTVAMTTGPFYHAGAFEVLLLPALFVHGTAVGMGSGGVTTSRILEAIRRARPTHVTLFSFTIYEMLRDESVTSDALDGVWSVMSGGDVLQDWAVEAFDARFPQVELGQGYGLTEGGTMSTYLDHQHRLSHAGTVGRPFILTDVEVRDPEGRPLTAGEIGEIWVRSNTLSPGYWNRPEANLETFVDGWCSTGDLGRFTDDGFLVLTGRAKDMIRSGAENIYPAEVEAALLGHPAVSAVAVVAVPDSKYVEVGCAVVAVEQGMDEAQLESELRALARSKLAHFKCPKHFVFVAELPVNHSGKIQKNVLRSRYEGLGSVIDHA